MQQPSIADYYLDLGIQKSATTQEVRQAYRELALKHHPDKKAPGATIDAEDFRKVQEAYELLRDELKRSDYDQVYEHIQREWEAYRQWQKSEDPFEQKRRIRAEERRRRAKASEDARRQARSWRNGYEQTEKAFQAAKDSFSRQRNRQERVEREELCAELDQCRRNMERADSWTEEVDRVLRKLKKDIEEIRDRYKVSGAQQ